MVEVWFCQSWFGLVRCCLVWFGKAWCDLLDFDMVWSIHIQANKMNNYLFLCNVLCEFVPAMYKQTDIQTDKKIVK